MNETEPIPGLTDKEQRYVLLALGGLLCGLPLFDVLVHGMRGIFSYLAVDSFYYLTVAMNFADHRFFTYDHIHSTNGFHPIWQLILGIYAFAFGWLDDPRAILIVVTFLTSLGTVTLGTLLAASAALKNLGRSSVLLLMIPVGVLVFVAWPFQMRYATFWNTINGMESGPAILFFGLATSIGVRPFENHRPRSAILFGASLGLMILSRLDLAFFLPAFVLVGLLALVGREASARRRMLLWGVLAATVAASFVFAYMLINKLTFGTLSPISGKMKSSFPVVIEGKLPQVMQFFAEGTWRQNLGTIWRAVHSYVPALLFGGWLLFSLGRSIFTLGDQDRPSLIANAWEAFLWVGCLGLLAGHLYNIRYVPFWAQGHWYFPVTFLFSTILCIHIVSGFLSSHRLFGVNRFTSVFVSLICIQALYFFAVFFPRVPLHERLGLSVEEPRELYYNAFKGRNAVAEFYGENLPNVVEYDDGIAGFVTGFPAISGLGLAIDYDLYEKVGGGKYFSSMLTASYERGFDRFASSFYIQQVGLEAEMTPEEVTHKMHTTAQAMEFTAWAWEIEYFAQDGSLIILRFFPLPG